MASVIRKKKHNKTYYYVATSARVNGKPRIIHQTYLGTAERLAQIVQQKFAPSPPPASRPSGPSHQAAARAGA